MRSIKCSPRKYVLVIFILLILFALLINPIIFVKDGIVSRNKVDNFQKQYSVESANKHDGTLNIRTMYLFYLGGKEIKVQEENMDEIVDVKVKKIAPFIYEWNISKDSWGVYRLVIGKNKYYCLFITN